MTQVQAQEKKASVVCTPEWYEVREESDGRIGPDERRTCPSSLSKGRCGVRSWRLSDLVDKGDRYERSIQTKASADPYRKEEVTIYKGSNRYFYRLERHEGQIYDEYFNVLDGEVWAFSLVLSVHGTCQFDR